MSCDGLLERDADVERIVDALTSVAAGAGRLIFVEGEAGLGKTELVRVAVAQARRRGFQTLAGHGVELERDFSFGVARQLFAPLVRERAECFSGPARLVRPLLDGSLPVSTGDGEFPFLHGLFWLVANLTERAPLLLAIDDAHWCDAPSLRALLYLVERLADVETCVMVAVRSGEPGSPATLLAQLVAHTGTCLVRPRPLSRCAVGEIVRGRLGNEGEGFVDACADVTEGNPFLLGELLAGVEAEAIVGMADGAERVRQLVPRRVLEVTLIRLAALGADASALARALAVLDGHGELGVAAVLAGLTPAAAAAPADALAAAHILRIDPSLSFAHPLLKTAVYRGIGHAERSRMHAAAARILFARGKVPPVVASQILASDPAAEPWVVARLRTAAREALAEGVPASSVRYLRRALEEPPTPAERAGVLAELASAEAAAGEPLAAQRLRAALELIEDPCSRAGLRLTLAGALEYRGKHVEAAEVLEAGRDELGADHSELRLELEAAFIAVARLEPALRVRAMPRLAELSRGLHGVTPVERMLLAHEANRRLFAGDPYGEVLDLVRRAWADGALVDDPRVGPSAATAVASTLCWCDEFDAYDDAMRAFQERAQRRGLVLDYADATYGLHISHHYRGQLGDAVAYAESAIDARRYGWRSHLATACSQLTWTLIEIDDLDGAERILQLPELEDTRGTLTYSLVHDARGRLAAARGDMRGALAEFQHAGRIAESAPMANPSYLGWRSAAGIAAARLGDQEQARTLVAEEIRRADRFGVARPRGVALRAAGLIEGGDAGIDMLRTAADRLAGSPARLEYARTLTDLGGALRRRGHRRDAREPLRAALELAIGFRATAIERRARSELIAAGARPRRRQFSGLDALTPGERRVAEMAAAGMSNREIAEALFVTLKAVQWHLGNTYRKLGISRRDDLPPEILGGTR